MIPGAGGTPRPPGAARVVGPAALALVNSPGRVHHLAVRPGAQKRTAALAGAVASR